MVTDISKLLLWELKTIILSIVFAQKLEKPHVDEKNR